jgi:organic radical activating enzyme
MVERDFRYWQWCNQLDDKGIYEGYFIDLTPRCNLSCKYCFHGRKGKDRSIADLMQELETCGKPGPVILFGGEPTIHRNFFKVCETIKAKYGEVSIVTNGTKTADPEFFKRLLPFTMQDGCNTSIHVSMHPESAGADFATLENARREGVKISSILCVIDSLDEIAGVIDMFRQYSDTVNSLRLKAASNLWAENRVNDRIYVSDILKELSKIASVQHIKGEGTKTSFCNVLVDGLHVMPVSWYGVDNIDLTDIDTAPWYRAKDGIPYNLATALVVNGGIDKGFYQGGSLENLDGLA